MKTSTCVTLSAIALAAAGAVTGSYMVGSIIEQRFTETAQRWSDEDALSISVQSYQRGWFTSNASTTWTLHDGDEVHTMQAQHRIVHGPWARGSAGHISTTFALPTDSGPELQQALGTQPPFTWQARLHWQGSSTHTLQSPAFEATYEDGSRLVWGGLQASASVNAQVDQAQGQMSLPELRMMDEDNARIELLGAQLQFTSSHPKNHVFWSGPAQLKVQSLHMITPNQETLLRIQNLAVDNNTSLKETMVNLDFKAQAEALETTYHGAQAVSIQAHLHRINAQWLDRWMQWTPGVEEADAELMPSLPDLLAGRPEFAIDHLRAQTAQGLVELSAQLRYVGQNPERLNLSTDLQAQLQTTVPRSVVEQVLARKVYADYVQLLEQLGQGIQEEDMRASIRDGVTKRLQGLQEQGALQEKDGRLTADLQLDAQGLRLNGQPTDFMTLLQLGSPM